MRYVDRFRKRNGKEGRVLKVGKIRQNEQNNSRYQETVDAKNGISLSRKIFTATHLRKNIRSTGLMSYGASPIKVDSPQNTSRIIAK